MTTGRLPHVERAARRSFMRVYLRALAYFRADWRCLALLLALVGIASGVNLLTAWPFALLVDQVLLISPTNPSRVGAHLPSNVAARIVVIACSALTLKLCGDALAALQTAVANQLNWRGTTRVREQLYDRLRAFGPDYYAGDVRPAGDALYRFTLDSLGPQQILGACVAACVAAITVAGVLSVLLTRNVPLTLVAVGVTPLLAIVNHLGGRRLAARASEVKRAETNLAAYVDRATDAAAPRSLNILDPSALFRIANASTLSAWWGQSRTQLTLNVLVGATQGIGAAAVLAYGGWLVHAGRGLSVGDLTLFLSYVAMLWGPLGTITGLGASLAGGAAGARRLFEVLDAPLAAPTPMPSLDPTPAIAA